MINGAHLHLLVNHVPLFGVVFGTIAMIWSSARKSDELRWAAVALFVLAGICGWITLESGESAEKIAEHLPGVTKALIEVHAEAGELANIAATILALGSVCMVLIARFKSSLLVSVQWTVILIALITTGLMARAANLGGQVRHTEIRSGATNAALTEGLRE